MISSNGLQGSSNGGACFPNLSLFCVEVWRDSYRIFLEHYLCIVDALFTFIMTVIMESNMIVIIETKEGEEPSQQHKE